jgi:hypothetical protein
MCTIANINARIAANPELERKKRLSRYQVNPEIAKKASKKWRLANLDKDKANKFNYHKKQMQVNMQYKLSYSLRIRLKKAILNNHKSGSAVECLGCSIDDFCIYLESKFEPWMTWDNYGKYDKDRPTWHIDHIKPCCSFDLTNPEEQRKCFHYTNLQPLWAIDNLRKATK